MESACQIRDTYRDSVSSATKLKFDSGSNSCFTDPEPVSSVKITGESKTLLTGKTMQLTAVVSPSNAANKSVKWTTSNKKYATVSASGLVKAKAAGAGKTITITAKAQDGSGEKATCKIKGAVKKIKLSASKKTIKRIRKSRSKPQSLLAKAEARL